MACSGSEALGSDDVRGPDFFAEGEVRKRQQARQQRRSRPMRRDLPERILPVVLCVSKRRAIVEMLLIVAFPTGLGTTACLSSNCGCGEGIIASERGRSELPSR